VVVTTYGSLVRDQELLSKRIFSTLIIDEAQALKNPRSQAHKAAVEMTARHRLALSGTPSRTAWASCGRSSRC
jgi:non-specific serine/threonine protein kinase